MFGANRNSWRAAVAMALLLGCAWGVAGCDASESQSLTEMNKGVAAYKQGSYGTAVDHFQKATEVWPDNHQAYYLMGQIYLHKYQEPDKAATFFGHATRLDPTKVDYWYQQGTALTEIKRNDEAATSLRKAVELKPNHSEALYRLGLLAERSGDPKQAAGFYGDSIKANARIPWAYYNLGDLYVRHEKYQEAMQVFENGVGNNPEHAEMRHGLGVAQLSLGRPDDARRSFEKALEIKRSYPSATYNLALSYLATGDKQKAAQYLETFLGQALGGKENSARIAAAEARLLEIKEEGRRGK